MKYWKACRDENLVTLMVLKSKPYLDQQNGLIALDLMKNDGVLLDPCG